MRQVELKTLKPGDIFVYRPDDYVYMVGRIDCGFTLKTDVETWDHRSIPVIHIVSGLISKEYQTKKVLVPDKSHVICM